MKITFGMCLTWLAVSCWNLACWQFWRATLKFLKSTQALQERDSTCIIGSVYKALTIAVVWYSLDFFNSLPRLTTLRFDVHWSFSHRLRLDTNLEKRKAHAAIKRLSPETMQKIANGYLFLDWFAIPQKLGILFLTVSRSVFLKNPAESKGIQRNGGLWGSRGVANWPGLRWVPHSSLILQLIYTESWLGTALYSCFHQGNGIWTKNCSHQNYLRYSLLDTTIVPYANNKSELIVSFVHLQFYG